MPGRLPPRDDLGEPLREHGEWHPQYIIDRLGPALGDGEILPYLVVASSILYGAQRMTILAQRLEVEARRVLPRLETLSKDPSLGLGQETIADLAARTKEAIRVLPGAKARASNDQQGGRGGGLRLGDLRNLTSAASAVIFGVEISTRPSPAGISRATKLMTRPPPFDLITTWITRLMPGTPPIAGFQLYVPPSLGRPILVYDDGRLAYDPLGGV